MPEGEIGELAVRGYVTPGYYRAPELDVEAFDQDGYFLTGDLGTIEADGRIRFRGRLKEMIKTGGVANYRTGVCLRGGSSYTVPASSPIRAAPHLCLS